MSIPKRLLSPVSLLAAIAICTLSIPAAADLKETLEAAMASELRSDAERARDANRKPVETLTFFGLKEDMRVLELLPGGGWYTKLLAPTLADAGKLYVAIGTDGVAGMQADGKLGGVEVVDIESDGFTRAEGERRFSLPGLKIPVKKIDLALTFRNLHNFSDAGRRATNESVFKALKKGGHYGVVDHTRRHMQADDNENWRRMDPVAMIKEIEAVGFELVDYSNLHYRLDDELRYEVGRRSISGNTDRFTLLFKKP
jgi:predicted methyltransferase